MKWFKRGDETTDKECPAIEERAEEIASPVDDTLLRAILGRTVITRKEALEIPSVQSCINFVADIVSMLPIRLYESKDGKTEEIKNDERIKILNSETGDTLDAVQFWRAIVADYYLGKGGYAYINKHLNSFVSLHYIEESNVSVMKNTDPIFKKFVFMVNGTPYYPYEFLKVLRNTKDGAQGTSITEENAKVLSVAYNTWIFEEFIVKKGGNKKGFLQSESRLAQEVMDELRESFRKLYGNNSENVIVLNKGITFQESSNTSVEMQLNENKETNSAEICKIFNMPISIIKGTASEAEYTNGFKMAVMPVLKAIQCALIRDYLLESEKGVRYWEFDTKEMLKGDIKARYEAYKAGLEANFLQIDEVRDMENLEPFGFDWIKLGLDSVLYNTKTGEVYTPNTDKAIKMDKLKGGEQNES